MAATNSVARRCNFARRRKSGRDAFIVGSSHEIDAAEEDLPPALAAGVRPPQRPGVVALLGLHAGAAMREDHATVRGRGRQLLPLARRGRSEEHTSELQSIMRISYAVCL